MKINYDLLTYMLLVKSLNLPTWYFYQLCSSCTVSFHIMLISSWHGSTAIGEEQKIWIYKIVIQTSLIHVQEILERETQIIILRSNSSPSRVYKSSGSTSRLDCVREGRDDMSCETVALKCRNSRRLGSESRETGLHSVCWLWSYLHYLYDGHCCSGWCYSVVRTDYWMSAVKVLFWWHRLRKCCRIDKSFINTMFS